MYAKNSSMNVSTSLAIATYKISEDFIVKKQKQLNINRNVKQ